MANPSASPPPSYGQTTRERTGGDISRKKKLLEKQKKGNVGGSENGVGRCFPDYTDAGAVRRPAVNTAMWASRRKRLLRRCGWGRRNPSIETFSF
jgi:hypothetical protein